jgi:hypothetical protein
MELRSCGDGNMGPLLLFLSQGITVGELAAVFEPRLEAQEGRDWSLFQAGVFCRGRDTLPANN